MQAKPASRRETRQARAPGGVSSRSWLIALLVAVACGLLYVWLSDEPTERSAASAPDDTPEAPPPRAPEQATAPAIPDTPEEAAAEAAPGQLIRRERWWQPGQPHDYGNDVDPFIRQPQDYGSDTPEILGNRISLHVYDLERVQDMVSRGDQPGSEIAQARGAPLTAEQRGEARRILQAFFDETVPDIDAILAGEMTRDEGYERIGPRRLELDRALREALGMTDKQLEGLWPHIAERNSVRDQLRD